MVLFNALICLIASQAICENLYDYENDGADILVEEDLIYGPGRTNDEFVKKCEIKTKSLIHK